jgi:vitamin B12 transporter
MKSVILSVFSTFLVLGALTAQTDSSTQILEEIVVTANRFEQKQIQTGKVVIVINRATLDVNRGRNIGEILNQYAGLTINGANNAPGTNLDVYMRGAGLGNTLILIDGVPVYDAASISSAFDINHINPEMLERVEILKGAQSTIYGSDAVAGVINFITRKSSDKKLHFNRMYALGSFGTRKIQVGLNTNIAKTQFNIQLQRFTSKGLSSALDTTNKSNFDKDGFKQTNLNTSLSGKLSKNISWKLYNQWSSYRADLDASGFTDDKDNRVNSQTLLTGLNLRFQLSKLVLHANFNNNINNRHYLDDSLSVGGFEKYNDSKFKGVSNFGELYANIDAGKHFKIITGVDARLQQTDQHYLSISSYGPYETSLSKDSGKINIYSMYASGYYSVKDKFFIEGGIRVNQHSRYGQNLTYTINPSYVINNWKLFANLSTAFKAPTLYQLFDPASGSAGLKPERSLMVEGGIQMSSFKNSWQNRLVFFGRKLKDGIDYSYISYLYFNNNKATDKGIELESTYKKGKWNINANYTYINGVVTTLKYKYNWLSSSNPVTPNGDTTYNYQFRRPANSVNVAVGYQVTKKIYGSIQAKISGKRMEPIYGDSPIAIKGYQVINVFGTYQISKKRQLFVDVKNLFNTKYIDINGFTTKPINFMVGMVINY